MSERIYLLPLWIRLWHWTNAALIITLGITGMSLHFSRPTALIEFSLAMRIHNAAGVALACLYTFFVIANAVTGNWWQYVPKPPGILQRCWMQTRYYCWGVFKGEPEPYAVTKEVNFNALQAVIYWLIMYIVLPVTVVTGLIFLYPQAAPVKLFGFDGLLPLAVLHFVCAVIILLFAVTHIYLGTMGVRLTSLYKTMITGWHEH
ncbi:cytochrome b/b6 domain-containing protein [Uliginosibacterium sp. H3]|uniref:Cytochrome b/b6 domain-containing protein n=1 Tax=Uliginosibacterium silvisoli TaxID=3114758 RepID=A0ABU6K2J4_9RHOO|nr:cytochrome b/b6 domain-containing protein [Uliginosibacterium sp. H3]